MLVLGNNHGLTKKNLVIPILKGIPWEESWDKIREKKIILLLLFIRVNFQSTEIETK